LTFIKILFIFTEPKLIEMKLKYLFPNYFKTIGMILFIPSVILGLIYLINQPEPDFLNIRVFAILYTDFLIDPSFFAITDTNAFDEIVGLVLMISLIFIAFSKEPFEDEFISRIRLESLVRATYFNYVILFLTIIFVYGHAFYWIMVINMFSILIFFIIRFNWIIYKEKKSVAT